MNIGAIILAAGSSSRMGQSKQLLPVEGEPLLLKTVNTVIAAGIKNIVCVLGANENEHRQILKTLPVQSINHHDWQKGMGSSLKKGMTTFITSYPEADAALILVCDQPLLTARHLYNLIHKHSQSKKEIIASRYANTVGVPVLFDKSFFKTLADVPDDGGAKGIISSHADQLATVDFPDGAIDLDTPEDYTRFKNKYPHA
jgi:molybdenum cofactor cytidylyltransferase